MADALSELPDLGEVTADLIEEKEIGMSHIRVVTATTASWLRELKLKRNLT